MYYTYTNTCDANISTVQIALHRQVLFMYNSMLQTQLAHTFIICANALIVYKLNKYKFKIKN